MTGRQRILKAVYPLWIAITKLMGKNTKVLANAKHVQPGESIYDLSVPLNNGSTLPLQQLKGKKLLLVNTASNCGYTNQYEDLQQLYQKFNNQLEIIAFPANDFKEQEKGSDNDIAQFCKINFGVTFPLAKKSVVVKSADQNNIFKWLTDKTKNGWNEQPPSWNFSKYLVDEEGKLTNYFDPSVSPLSEEIIKAVKSRTLNA
jgi:glutathione peroxidase